MQDHYIDINGVQTRYWRAGDGGTPVVMLHGIASSVEDWAPTIPALADGRATYALDLLGCGRTDKPAEQSFSPQEMVDHVLGFLDAMGIEQADLIGWSMGGRMALDLAGQAPDRVRRIILVAPAGVGPDTIINMRLAAVPGLGEVLTKPSMFGLRMLVKAATFDKASVTDEVVAERLQFAKLPGAQAAFLKQLRAFVGFRGFLPGPMRRLQAVLSAIDAPTLAIWGRQDAFVPHTHAEILLQQMPDCRAEVIEECGHLPQSEQPERFNTLVSGFLSG